MNRNTKIYFSLLKVLSILLFVTFLVSCETESIENESQILEIKEMLKSRPNAEQLDSIYQIVKSFPLDSTRVDLYIGIYKRSIRKKPLRIDVLDSALNQAIRINYILGIAQAYDKKGLNFRYTLKYLKAVENHKLALGYFRQTTDTFRTVKCLNSLGVALRRLNYEREAIDYYLEALHLSKEIKSNKSIAVALNGIGNVFVNIEQYEKAMPYFREALALEKLNGNKRGINYDLSNIGEALMFQHKYDSALHYYYQALDIANELSHKDNASIIYNCIGQLYQLKNQHEQSNEYYKKALPKLIEYDGKRYLSNTYINIGLNYNYLGNSRLAIENINKGLLLAQEIHSAENITLAYQALYHHYKKEEKFDSALINYEKTIVLRDSLKGEETKRNIAALETIYENARKDNEIKKYQYDSTLQDQQSTIQILAIFFLLFVVIVFLLFYRIKGKNDKLAMEQMRRDIRDYLQRIEEFEKNPKENGQNEQETFDKNVEQYGLSSRELDVLRYISQGLKNEEIAEKLFLSVSTIKTHTRNIFIKLDVRNRIEAARKAQNI